MKTTLITAAMVATLSFTALAGAAQASTVGQPAPAFTLTDSNGKTHNLADFKGKTVVLEWTNAECPFVKKHYGAGNMQKQQADATGKDVIWLSINSSAPGLQGHVDGSKANAIRTEVGAKQSAYLLDASGDVGRAYGAKTTPHMYVIDGNGVLRYNGAIDSIASTDQADIPKATQYVSQALTELAAGKPISVSTSKPYGCSVKYKS